jgi:hypothetical protein
VAGLVQYYSFEWIDYLPDENHATIHHQALIHAIKFMKKHK